MNPLRRLFERKRAKRSDAGGVGQSFIAEVEWHRSEELRPDRLGPSEDDLVIPVDPWRPRKTLGPMPKR